MHCYLLVLLEAVTLVTEDINQQILQDVEVNCTETWLSLVGCLSQRQNLTSNVMELSISSCQHCLLVHRCLLHGSKFA